MAKASATYAVRYFVAMNGNVAGGVDADSDFRTLDP